jgi:Predicted Permease Membrane Region
MLRACWTKPGVCGNEHREVDHCFGTGNLPAPVAIGTILGRVKFKGFALGTTACILIVAVILWRFGTFVIPPLFKSIFFSLFVFTIASAARWPAP